MSGYFGYRVFLPFCIQRLADGRYIVLNRDYKPLGIPSGDWVDYETHPTAHPMEITPDLAKLLSVDGSENLDCIHLYRKDGPPEEGEHLRAYADRLAVLMRLNVEVPRPYRIPPSSAPR